MFGVVARNKSVLSTSLQMVELCRNNPRLNGTSLHPLFIYFTQAICVNGAGEGSDAGTQDGGYASARKSNSGNRLVLIPMM